VLGPEKREHRKLEVVRIALQQLADTLVLPVGQPEGPVERLLLGERRQPDPVYFGNPTSRGYVVPTVTRRQLVMLLALSAIWGSSFMFIKVGVRQLEPSSLVAGRLLLAALTLVVIVALRTPLRTAFKQIRAHLRPFLFVALFNSVVPFWLLAWGETRIDSGLAALLQACAPLFTALLAAFFVRSERVEGRRLVGVLVGFGGVAALIRGAGASRAILVTYLVPPMALFYGATVLGEGLKLTDLAGLALILLGVSLGTGVVQSWRRRAALEVRA
jgi:drug/metabolite transporter (DMT)-like permease